VVRPGASSAFPAALFVTGIAAGIVVAGGGASSDASRATSHSEATTRVTVTATDSKFKLSSREAHAGLVIFTVTNGGKVSHDFAIAGKKTPLLSPRHSATLRVRLSKKGRYPYRSTVTGQASAGMKGIFSVVASPPVTTTTPAATTTASPPTIGSANTTVAVDMFDSTLPGLFDLSPSTVPSGTVTFVITNKCNGQCSFDLEGIKAGAILDPGQSETWTVALAPGIYEIHCDVLPAMKGRLIVTT
jgi:uncharacterized cupredoxin-like copper-binding protein